MAITLISVGTCKKATLTAPDSSTLIVTVNPSIIPLGGQAVVHVVGYKASGTTVPDGTVVFFSTNIGTIEARKETHDGVADAIFQSNDNRSGIAALTITSGNAEVTPEEITITVGSSALNALAMTASPNVLPPGGGVSTIRIVAYDEDLNPLANVAVVMTTDAGELNSKGGVITTNSSGVAEDLLQTKNTAEVTATSGEITGTVTVTVEDNETPEAVFVFSPTSPVVDEKVHFNASGSYDPDGTIVSYRWDFGDGAGANGETVSHRYKQAGTYSVVLVVVDDSGKQDSTSQTVPVTDGDTPNASFVYSPGSPKQNEEVYFNASESYDPDGTIESYVWDFGDGSGGTGRTITHSFAKEGSYSVVLVVTDNNGNTDSTSQTVTVGENENPTASFVYSPTSPKVDEDVYFNASDSSDPDGTIESYEWDFGDNTTGSGETVTHKYTTDGSFTVHLEVTDNSGNTGSTSKTITVSTGQKPTASFVYSPTNPITGETVYFNASNSTDPDGMITSYRWDFGDGDTGRGENVTHEYQVAGTYKVVLTVTDNDGNEGNSTQQVTVKDNVDPVATFTVSPSYPSTGETVHFNASESYDTDGTIVSWQWDFGDGTTGSGESVTHQFTTANTYTVTLTVTDNSGNTDSYSKTVPVS